MGRRRHYDFKLTVFLCGSSRFKDEFMKVAADFSNKGYVVLMPDYFPHCGDKPPENLKEKLKEIHDFKLKAADYVYVINKNHYIGDNTKEEINMAMLLEKEIGYLE